MFKETLQPTAAVLLLTGHAALEDTPDATGLGAFEYMLKTASPEEVLTRVADTIRRRAGTNPDSPHQ